MLKEHFNDGTNNRAAIQDEFIFADARIQMFEGLL
jgi:hypothetical protein